VHEGVGEIVLVTAPDDDELQAWGRGAGLRIALNPAPERGMLSSIREGIVALGGKANAFEIPEVQQPLWANAPSAL
jgi:CTP:molybdopterin cytidylyltransferase MocA